MDTMQQRAAILVQVKTVGVPTPEEQREACRRYCQEQGYEISEHHIYHSEPGLLYRSAPQLVQIRLLVVQGQLDVLIIPWSECLGPLPLWRSLPTAKCIDAFYSYHVRIESVMKRNGVHDIFQQMYIDAVRFIEQMDTQQTKPHYPYKRYDQNKEQM